MHMSTRFAQSEMLILGASCPTMQCLWQHIPGVCAFLMWLLRYFYMKTSCTFKDANKQSQCQLQLCFWRNYSGLIINISQPVAHAFQIAWNMEEFALCFAECLNTAAEHSYKGVACNFKYTCFASNLNAWFPNFIPAPPYLTLLTYPVWPLYTAGAGMTRLICSGQQVNLQGMLSSSAQNLGNSLRAAQCHAGQSPVPFLQFLKYLIPLHIGPSKPSVHRAIFSTLILMAMLP